VRRLVSDHHERLDGTGYPRGLPAEDLPIETRILAVCDVYDALVSDRVYRAAWTSEQALALLRDEAGYDDAVVAALQRIVTGADAQSWVAGITGSTHGPPVVRPSWTAHP
jgi:putative two-component system response regulator